MARAISSGTSAGGPANGFSALPAARFNALIVCLFHAFAPLVKALPIVERAVRVFEEEDGPKDPKDARLWVYLGTAIALVLLGGVFAGLTIALMGQDEIYLQVIATSGEGKERKNASTVLRLLKRGKHWVLVTLLLSNVITNETLPIVLDRSLGGGWPAVLSSTVLIVIFGEVVPQSICVRYGLPIGAWMAPIVLGLMWIMAPVAWPTAKLLDYLLGEDHGTTYKKAGLKTLVTLHKTLGASADERLNQDEVTIISAVLDLKAKPVGSIMTPMKDVFTMSTETVLDEPMMDIILSAGYSRIPIHTPENPKNFVGMLLVKMLITYDPEDALHVRDFALATLPETRPETSCLDIINFFQEGKSHMVLVSEFPGEDHGAVGVVTLEDVIEELIGEEIIDESDVFIDVHKAIRRMAPAPRTRAPGRAPKGEVVTDDSHLNERELGKAVEDSEHHADGRKRPSAEHPHNSKLSTLLLRRRSSGNVSDGAPVPLDGDLKEHLKHLGPSNAANKPKTTRINTVKIKPALSTVPEHRGTSEPRGSIVVTSPVGSLQSGVGEGTLENGGRGASDAVHSVALGYGTMTVNQNGTVKDSDNVSWRSGRSRPRTAADHDDVTSPGTAPDVDETSKLIIDHRPNNDENEPRKERSHSVSTLGSLKSIGSRSRSPINVRPARSGSISENVVDLNGVKKIVLETTSSSDSEEKATGKGKNTDGAQVRITSPTTIAVEKKSDDDGRDESQDPSEGDKLERSGTSAASDKKKKRKKRGKKKKGSAAGEAGSAGENKPLLG